MFKKFLAPCAGGGGHRPQGFQDGRRLLLQVLADVQDHREGDQDDHQAQRKSEGVAMMFQSIEKQITLTLYKPDSRSDVQ